MKLLMMAKKKAKANKQSGFTLLELLVVVAILAAIAGTATIALKDTDARASAAAHVAMMDELNKGIQTYRVLKRNEFPNNFDSLMQEAAAAGTNAAVRAGSTMASGSDDLLGWEASEAVTGALTADVLGILNDAGVTSMMYINTANTVGTTSCAEPKTIIGSRSNDVVAGNIFMTTAANGCGERETLVTGSVVTFWNGGSERLTGQQDPAGSGSAYNAATNHAYMLTGMGPSCTLFDANTLGGMTTVPVYRHVKPDQYGRFIAVWNVGTYDGAGAIVAGDQLDLVAIVDGALDTKEEELGEWDGTRNTL